MKRLSQHLRNYKK